MTRLYRQWAVLAGALSLAALAATASTTDTPQGIRLTTTELEALDEFAITHLDTLQAPSFQDGIEYCGLFGYDANGTLAATPATPGEIDSCQPNLEPRGFTVIATYHTHGSHTWDADTEVPSIGDLTGDIDEQTYGYISTPGGRVWFNDWETEEALLLCGKDCVTADPNFQDCPSFMPGRQYTVPQLRERTQNDTGEC